MENKERRDAILAMLKKTDKPVRRWPKPVR